MVTYLLTAVHLYTNSRSLVKSSRTQLQRLLELKPSSLTNINNSRLYTALIQGVSQLKIHSH